jgi:hypothetical protein
VVVGELLHCDQGDVAGNPPWEGELAEQASQSPSSSRPMLDKPSWQPPDAVFWPVWSVLYALIAASMLVVRRRAGWHRPLFVL